MADESEADVKALAWIIIKIKHGKFGILEVKVIYLYSVEYKQAKLV